MTEKKFDEGYNEVISTITNKSAPFKKHQTNTSVAQCFDKEKITVKRKGKVQNMYDWTQATAGQNDYYQVLEKYHGDDSAAKAELIKNAQDIGDELRNINSMEDIWEMEKASLNSWNNLPLSVRQEFGNNRANWQKNGAKWLEQKQAELVQALQQEQHEEIQPVKDKEEA